MWGPAVAGGRRFLGAAGSLGVAGPGAPPLPWRRRSLGAAGFLWPRRLSGSRRFLGFAAGPGRAVGLAGPGLLTSPGAQGAAGPGAPPMGPADGARRSRGLADVWGPPVSGLCRWPRPGGGPRPVRGPGLAGPGLALDPAGRAGVCRSLGLAAPWRRRFPWPRRFPGGRRSLGPSVPGPRCWSRPVPGLAAGSAGCLAHRSLGAAGSWALPLAPAGRWASARSAGRALPVPGSLLTPPVPGPSARRGPRHRHCL